MTRKLLPYEHQLIEQLGVSEQEYLDFLQVQFDYTTTPAQRLEKPQADVATVALVLTIIGTLLQVASVLLAPKPSQGKAQLRDQVFAPRFGFNSAQELAKYGEPVNLIYTNIDDNSLGGVRVNTSLIWSAVRSYGSSQFMQLMTVIGAGVLEEIDINRIAFGQTPIKQFTAQKSWIYHNPAGILLFSDVKSGDANQDPTRDGQATDAIAYRVVNGGASTVTGFSQAYSPTTLTRCGVYAPIPINVDNIVRNPSGKQVDKPLGITITDAAFLANYWPTFGRQRNKIPVGTRFTLQFDQTTILTPGQKEYNPLQSAQESRRSLASNIDAASIYKLGSARFRLAAALENAELDEDPLIATFECIEAGVCPAEDYGTTNFQDNEAEIEDQIIAVEAEIASLENQLNLNPPIYTPVTVTNTSITGELQQITTDKVQIQEWIEAVRGFRGKGSQYGSEADKATSLEVLANNSLSDPIVSEIANSILLLRDKLEDTSGKKAKRALNQSINKAEKELSVAINLYGVVEGFVRSPRTGAVVKGKAEIAALNSLLSAKDESAWGKILGAISISGGGRDTVAEQERNAALQSQLDQKNSELTVLEDYLNNPAQFNNLFYTKCLTKVEDASYETISGARSVNFALRARVFKRVNGRAKNYGEKTVKKYSEADNGYKLRVMLFWVLYREVPTQPGAQAKAFSRAMNGTVPHIFAIRRSSDLDNFMDLRFISPDKTKRWEFRFEPIAETVAEMLTQGNANFAYIENSGGTLKTIANPADGTKWQFHGTIEPRNGQLPPLNNNPADLNEWTLFSNRSDAQLTFSFDNGPELEIKAVTEQAEEENLNGVFPRLYNNLSLLGFNVYSGQGVQDLRSISVFAKKGRKVRKIADNGTYPSEPNGASSYAPDIFLDTILDKTDGIGRYAVAEGIDIEALAKAKKFCKQNNLFMDGVIAEQVPWRQFWAETAPFSLLELGRIGGRETLVPVLPCDDTGKVFTQVKVQALFNAGNILEDSYREEFIDYGANVQDLVATVIYRETEAQGMFPRNRSVDVHLTTQPDGSSFSVEDNAVRQTFDLSQFVTNRSQAIKFAKLLCNQRRHIRKAIEFKTFPTDSVLSPGAYIYVDVGQAQWNNIYSGSIEAGGALNTPLDVIVNGTYTVLVWKSKEPTVAPLTSIVITNNRAAALAPYDGWLFVLGAPVKSKRVFRITEVQMDEEGEISVKAMEHPCDPNGNSLIAIGVATVVPGLFTIDTLPE